MLKYVNKELEAAVNDLERLSQDDRAMIAYAKELRYSGQYEANIEAAKTEGIDLGKDLGRAEGINLGKDLGRAEGIAEERIKNAIGFKKANVDIDIIVACTGLSKEEVLAL